MHSSHFNTIISSEAELRTMLGIPSELAIRKVQPALDQHARAFIAQSPFLLIGTSNEHGNLDVSPRGDLPGFAMPLDERTLVIPDRPGNRRIDTLRNILANPQIGLLFLIPGIDETLRINGRALIARDEALLERTAVQGKKPKLVIGVEVQECFFHCAKAFRRSKLWDAAQWPERSSVATLGTVLKDQLKIEQSTAVQIDCDLEESYARTMY
jgi:PPOX class probable FMN-dependent enzyme